MPAASAEGLKLGQLRSIDDLGALLPASRLGSPVLLSGTGDHSRLSDLEYGDGDDIAGRYVLIGEGPGGGPIGRGAFGEVWHAYEGEFDRHVALKILRTRTCSANAFLRFDLEKQVLARMQHPNIALVFDGGVTHRKEPYLAMEYVRGTALDEYCERHQLPVRDRLALFAAICRGVHHAHERLVLHRDLKPSNILIVEENGVPIPKIIDFGIAKVLGDGAFSAEGATTKEGFIKGTPAYMSPEQTRSGDELTVRSDVYSLGVLLYEILVGETPLAFMCAARSDLIETLTAIRESEPIAPSAAVRLRDQKCLSFRSLRFDRARDLSRCLRGDLDAVALRATRRLPEARYHTAAALSNDVELHLRDEPVTARAPSDWYRFSRFLRRHRGAAISGAITVVALLVTAIVCGVSLIRVKASLHRETQASALAVRKQGEAVVSEAKAQVARKSAVVAREQAESLINYMLFDLRRQLEPLGRSGLLAGVAESANDYFSRQPTSTDNPNLQRNRGVASFNQGFILLARGEVSQALNAFEKAHSVMESRMAQAKTERTQLDYAMAVHGLAVALRASGRLDEARVLLQTVTPFLRGQHVEADGEATRLLAANLEQLGELQLATGDTAAALQLFAEEEQSIRKMFSGENASPADALGMAVACEKVGTALLLLNLPSKALPKFQEEALLLRHALAVEPDNLQMRHTLSVALEKLGNVYLANNNPKLAFSSFEQRLAEAETLTRIDARRLDFRRELGVAHHSMAKVYLALDNRGAALQHAVQDVEMAAQLVRDFPTDRILRQDLAASRFQAGIAKLKQGNTAPIVEGAKSEFRQAIQLFHALEEEHALDSNGVPQLTAAEDTLKQLEAAGAKAISKTVSR